jgi:hypothetical protein
LSHAPSLISVMFLNLSLCSLNTARAPVCMLQVAQ